MTKPQLIELKAQATITWREVGDHPHGGSAGRRHKQKGWQMAKWGWHRCRRWEEKEISVLTDRQPPPLRGNPEPGRKQALGRRGEADIREVAVNIKSSAMVSTSGLQLR